MWTTAEATPKTLLRIRLLAQSVESRSGERVQPHHAESECAGGPRDHPGAAHVGGHIVSLVANGMTPAQIVADLPDLEEEDVREALGYAAALARGDYPAAP